MTKPIPKEMIKAMWFQMKKKHAFKNIFITHNAFGVFSLASHQNTHSNEGKPKVMYNTLATAEKAAASMGKKHNTHFSVYKCGYCKGYHIGKNRDNRVKTEVQNEGKV